jgi:cell division protein FtsI (penicillin-binding protein 3)
MGSWCKPIDSLARTSTGNLIAKIATGRTYNTLFTTLNKKIIVPQGHSNELMQLSNDSTRQSRVTPAAVYKDIIPDVKGMGLKDAVYVLENCGLQVQIQGKGRVQSQSIVPGTKASKGLNIIIYLG